MKVRRGPHHTPGTAQRGSAQQVSAAWAKPHAWHGTAWRGTAGQRSMVRTTHSPAVLLDRQHLARQLVQGALPAGTAHHDPILCALFWAAQLVPDPRRPEHHLHAQVCLSLGLRLGLRLNLLWLLRSKRQSSRRSATPCCTRVSTVLQADGTQAATPCCTRVSTVLQAVLHRQQQSVACE